MSEYSALVQHWVQHGASLAEAQAAARKVHPTMDVATRVDHSEQIARLRSIETVYARLGTDITSTERTIGLAYATAADLLEIHDATGISLDNWTFARNLVEHLLDEPIKENHA